jgi:hypothetical protein
VIAERQKSSASEWGPTATPFYRGVKIWMRTSNSRPACPANSGVSRTPLGLQVRPFSPVWRILDSAYFMHTRNTSKAVPLVAAAFAPARYPMYPMLFFCVRAEVDAASPNAGLITSVKCSGIHIALLSSHRVCPRGRMCPRKVANSLRSRPLRGGFN